MVKGMRSYDPKQRRRIRRQNHIHKDLRTPKYRQRVEKNKFHDYEQAIKYKDWEKYIEEDD